MQIDLALAYDDVLLMPHYSEILPEETNLQVELSPTLTLPLPILSSAMDTVTETDMAIALAKCGGLGVIHRNMPAEQQAAAVQAVKTTCLEDAEAVSSRNAPTCDAQQRLAVAAAIGATPDDLTRAHQLIRAEVDALVIDTAHGHSRNVVLLIEQLRQQAPHTVIIAGNVATPAATRALLQAGAHWVKVGIGPGSICTTRIVTGVGVPQFTAVLSCAEAARAVGGKVIADGGIRTSGDAVKALAAGAHAIMLGNILAGTPESPGRVVLRNEQAYKVYAGMGSQAAMQRGSAARYGYRRNAPPGKNTPEGIESWVPLKPPLQEVLQPFVGGIRAGMGYLGAPDLATLRQHAQFVRTTPAGVRESHVHDVEPQ
jgi:IMP dehydrogenase